jgi:hypothetical protein
MATETNETTAEANPNPKPKRVHVSRSWELLSIAYGITGELMEREGVTDDDLEARIDQFLEDADNKLNAHRYMRASAASTSRMIRDEAARLVAVARKLDKVAERCNRGAQMVLEARVEATSWEEGRKLESVDGVVYLSKRQALEIDDDSELLALLSGTHFVKVKESLDKTAITAAVKANDRKFAELANGLARMVDKTSITWAGPKQTGEGDA